MRNNHHRLQSTSIFRFDLTQLYRTRTNVKCFNSSDRGQQRVCMTWRVPRIANIFSCIWFHKWFDRELSRFCYRRRCRRCWYCFEWFSRSFAWHINVKYLIGIATQSSNIEMVDRMTWTQRVIYFCAFQTKIHPPKSKNEHHVVFNSNSSISSATRYDRPKTSIRRTDLNSPHCFHSASDCLNLPNSSFLVVNVMVIIAIVNEQSHVNDKLREILLFRHFYPRIVIWPVNKHQPSDSHAGYMNNNPEYVAVSVRSSHIVCVCVAGVAIITGRCSVQFEWMRHPFGLLAQTHRRYDLD